MDTSLPVEVIRQLAQQAMDLSEVFASTGQHIAYSLLVMSIILYVLNLYGGLNIAAATFDMVMWSSFASWLTSYWADVILFCLNTSDAAMRLLGADGVGGLFALASRLADRISMEPLGWGLSIDGTAGATLRAILLAATTIMVTIGLCLPALLALLAQVALILGGMAAPLVVGFLAFSLTRSWGMAGLTFMLSATLRIIVLGATSVVFARAVESTLTLPGTNEALTTPMITGMWLLSVLSIICALGANRIASSLTGQGGALGLDTLGSMGGSLMRGGGMFLRSRAA